MIIDWIWKSQVVSLGCPNIIYLYSTARGVVRSWYVVGNLHRGTQFPVIN